MIKNNLHLNSNAAMQRYPNYLRYLVNLEKLDVEFVSSTMIANAIGITPMLVKKDLAPIIKNVGQPKIGYQVNCLIKDLNDALGYGHLKDAVIVGVGQLGRVLLNYPGFKDYGTNICVGFDNSSTVIGSEINGVKILNIDKFEDLIKRMEIHIGIITVNKDCAQDVADMMVRSGIKAIWNWAPVNIKVPKDIALKNEDVGLSLAILSNMMKEKKE